MTNKLLSLIFFVALFIQGCTGPEGIPGRDGQQGPAGPSSSTTFDIANVTFTRANDFSAVFQFPKTVEVLESDAVLVYREWATLSDPTGPISVWRLLPQTVNVNGGTIQYNFDHTFLETYFYLNSSDNVNRETIGAEFRQNQKFRVVIIPADYGKRTTQAIDYNDYKAVKKYYNIDESTIATYKAK